MKLKELLAIIRTGEIHLVEANDNGLYTLKQYWVTRENSNPEYDDWEVMEVVADDSESLEIIIKESK